MGRQRLAEIADRILALSSADQTEVLITATDENLTRFAANTIHQNVSETNISVRVRVVFGQKIGVALGNELTDEGLYKVVHSAETVAQFQQDNPDFRSLPSPQSIKNNRSCTLST